MKVGDTKTVEFNSDSSWPNYRDVTIVYDDGLGNFYGHCLFFGSQELAICWESSGNALRGQALGEVEELWKILSLIKEAPQA